MGCGIQTTGLGCLKLDLWVWYLKVKLVGVVERETNSPPVCLDFKLFWNIIFVVNSKFGLFLANPFRK